MQQRVEVEVNQLLIAGADGPDAEVTEEDIADFPEPVRRYLRYAGVVGRSRIRTARTRERGRIRYAPGQPWFGFSAVEHYAVFPSAFHWHARVEIAPFVELEIRDGYFSGYGEIFGRLASFVPVLQARGPETDQAALVRYLSEMVYFPTAFVDEVRWEPLDDASARAFYEDEGLEVAAVCTFDNEGRMVNFVAERYRAIDDRYERYPWSTPLTGYRDIDGFMIPTSRSAIWHMGEDEFEYIDLVVDDVSFDVH